MSGLLPNRNEVIAASVAAVVIYAAFSAYVVIWLRDATMTGDVIGTWKSFAVLAFGFWLGSSSGSKTKDNPSPAGTPNDPVSVEEVKA